MGDYNVAYRLQSDAIVCPFCDSIQIEADGLTRWRCDCCARAWLRAVPLPVAKVLPK